MCHGPIQCGFYMSELVTDVNHNTASLLPIGKCTRTVSVPSMLTHPFMPVIKWKQLRFCSQPFFCWVLGFFCLVLGWFFFFFLGGGTRKHKPSLSMRNQFFGLFFCTNFFMHYGYEFSTTVAAFGKRKLTMKSFALYSYWVSRVSHNARNTVNVRFCVYIHAQETKSKSKLSQICLFLVAQRLV